jgi:hypothetical protein
VVIGNSPIEKYWVGEMRDTLKPLHDRIVLTFLNEMPFDELLKRVATLLKTKIRQLLHYTPPRTLQYSAIRMPTLERELWAGH